MENDGNAEKEDAKNEGKKELTEENVIFFRVNWK